MMMACHSALIFKHSISISWPSANFPDQNPTGTFI